MNQPREKSYVNSGALFQNDNKFKESQPDSRGEAEVCCPHCGAVTSYWLSAWWKVSRAGKQFLSMAFSHKEPAPQHVQPQWQPNQFENQTAKERRDNGTPVPSGFDDDIPFD